MEKIVMMMEQNMKLLITDILEVTNATYAINNSLEELHSRLQPLQKRQVTLKTVFEIIQSPIKEEND